MKLVSLLALVVAAGPAMAQDNGWSYRSTLYLWFPGLSATVETPYGSVEGDLSPSDALSNLDMAFMGTVAAQNGPWEVIGDLVYTDLSATNPTPFGLAFSDVTTKTKLTAITLYGLYDVNPAPEVQVGLGFGVRAFDINLDTTLTGTPGTYTQSSGDSWVVPVLAAQLYAPLDDTWFVNGVADWGKTGNDNETWQIYAGVGYRFNENWSTQLGYRYMNLSKQLNEGNVDLGLSGVLLGVTYDF